MTVRTWVMSIAAAMVLAAGWTVAARRHPPPLRSAHSEPARSVPGGLVVLTAAGKMFHREGCTFVHGPVELRLGGQAIADGYTPCTRCLPAE